MRDLAGRRVAKRGGGGVVTALGGLLAHHDVTWVASAMTEEDRAVAAEKDGSFVEETADGASYRLRLVAHDPALLRGSLRLLRATGAYIHTLDTALGTIDRILRARKQGLADGRRAPHAHDTATTPPHER